MVVTAQEMIKKDIDTDASYLAHLIKSGKTSKPVVRRMLMVQVATIMRRINSYL